MQFDEVAAVFLDGIADFFENVHGPAYHNKIVQQVHLPLDFEVVLDFNNKQQLGIDVRVLVDVHETVFHHWVRFHGLLYIQQGQSQSPEPEVRVREGGRVENLHLVSVHDFVAQSQV